MCKLLVGQTNDVGSKEFQKIIQLQYEKLESQPHGIGAFVVTNDNKQHLFRELVDYDKVFEAVNALLPTAKLVAMHTRVSTGGAKDLSNVHMFEKNGYVFAHNGWVSGITSLDAPKATTCVGCTTAKTPPCKRHRKSLTGYIPVKSLIELGDCDSKEFITNLTNEYEVIDEKVIANNLNIYHFKGVGFLYDTKTNTPYLFANQRKLDPIQVLTNKKTFAVFFSYEPETELTYTKQTYRNVFGVPVLDGEKERKVATKLVAKDVYDSVYKLDTTIDEEAYELDEISEPVVLATAVEPIEDYHNTMWKLPSKTFTTGEFASSHGTCDMCGEQQISSNLDFDRDAQNTVCKSCQ